MGALWQDVRFGLWMLAKNPGFTAVAVLTLALGIGANAAIFSILDPLLLRKLPVQNPDELVLVHATGSLGLDGTDAMSPMSMYSAYRDHNTVFSGVLVVWGFATEVTKDRQTATIDYAPVTGNFFDVLGVPAFRGRLLASSDTLSPDGSPVAVLSFDYWRTAFNADEGVLGKSLTIRDRPYTIIGVAPPGFYGIELGRVPSIYVPISYSPKNDPWVPIVARLKPGVSPAQARAGLEPLFKQVMAESLLPEIEKQQEMSRLVLTPVARGLSESLTQFSLPAKILMGIVGLVLLIACSNVANLLFARSAARRKEITIRLALGAGRWRLVRQLLTESALLAAMGAALGLLAANWISRVLILSLSTEKLQVHLAAGITGRVLLFTAGALVVTVLLCGLAPALAATRGALANDLKVQGSGRSAASRLWLAQSPIVMQVALCVTILSGAGLLLHSLYNLETTDVGFDRDSVVTMTFGCCRSATRSTQDTLALEAELLSRARNLPGVRNASYSSYSQTSRELGVNVAVEGAPAPSVDEQHVFFNTVSPGYFETMGIPILAGRDFSSHDDANVPLAIINRTMARHYFGESNPIGRRFKFVEGNKPPMEIVGVVADSVYNDIREQTPDFVYLDHTKVLALRGPVGATALGGVLNVRAKMSARALSRPLSDLIRSFDSAATITSIRALREQVDLSLHQDRLIAGLCSIFSALALMLTCVGLYGTLSFSVARRTNEIGVRMALGAEPRDIFRLVVGGGMRLTLAGLLLGAGGAIASGSLLASLLFGVKRTDPVTFAGVAVLLIGAAVLACYIPARRAMRTDPLVALRYE